MDRTSFLGTEKDECRSNNSFVLHPIEVGQIPYFLRSIPPIDTRFGVQWKKEIFRIRKPSFLDRGRRCVLNFYNMLRDAFGQADQAILGAVTKYSSFSQVKDSNKRMNEMQAGLNELETDAWEPITEKYRGHPIVVERKTSAGVITESGILEDYSLKYLLVREVHIREPELLNFLQKNPKFAGTYDLVYAGSSSIIRYTICDPI